MVEQVLAGIGLLACGAMLAWMLLGPERRKRMSERARPAALGRQLARGLHWRTHRRAARTEAEQAIERARRRAQVEREGNVYRPKSFDRDAGPRGEDDDPRA